MLPSPIQVKDITYLGFKVWARPLGEGEELDDDFDFTDVIIGESVEVAVLGDKDDPEKYAVKLRIVIDNKEGKLAPYEIDVEVAGLFTVNRKTAIKDKEDLIVVNGCAVLYGSIRDLVLNLTTRSASGPLMLPTVNFLDKRKNGPHKP